jgi:hypothetical protein
LAHNVFLKYGSDAGAIKIDGGTHPVIFVEGMGHGQEAWRGDDAQGASARNGYLVYRCKGKADNPETSSKDEVGYDLLPFLNTLWPRAFGGKNETYGEENNYGILSLRVAAATAKDAETEQHVRLGVLGSAFNGVVGAANMARPPWGWFDGEQPNRPLGEWFLQPAETIRRRWNLPAESFSTTYVYHPFAGVFRAK